MFKLELFGENVEIVSENQNFLENNESSLDDKYVLAPCEDLQIAKNDALEDESVEKNDGIEDCDYIRKNDKTLCVPDELSSNIGTEDEILVHECADSEINPLMSDDKIVTNESDIKVVNENNFESGDNLSDHEDPSPMTFMEDDNGVEKYLEDSFNMFLDENDCSLAVNSTVEDQDVHNCTDNGYQDDNIWKSTMIDPDSDIVSNFNSSVCGENILSIDEENNNNVQFSVGEKIIEISKVDENFTRNDLTSAVDQLAHSHSHYAEQDVYNIDQYPSYSIVECSTGDQIVHTDTTCGDQEDDSLNENDNVVMTQVDHDSDYTEDDNNLNKNCYSPDLSNFGVGPSTNLNADCVEQNDYESHDYQFSPHVKSTDENTSVLCADTNNDSENTRSCLPNISSEEDSHLRESILEKTDLEKMESVDCCATYEENGEKYRCINDNIKYSPTIVNSDISNDSEKFEEHLTNFGVGTETCKFVSFSTCSAHPVENEEQSNVCASNGNEHIEDENIAVTDEISNSDFEIEESVVQLEKFTTYEMESEHSILAANESSNLDFVIHTNEENVVCPGDGNEHTEHKDIALANEISNSIFVIENEAQFDKRTEYEMDELEQCILPANKSPDLDFVIHAKEDVEPNENKYINEIDPVVDHAMIEDCDQVINYEMAISESSTDKCKAIDNIPITDKFSAKSTHAEAPVSSSIEETVLICHEILAHVASYAQRNHTVEVDSGTSSVETVAVCTLKICPPLIIL